MRPAAAWRAGRKAERGKASRAPGRPAAARIRISIGIDIRHMKNGLLNILVLSTEYRVQNTPCPRLT